MMFSQNLSFFFSNFKFFNIEFFSQNYYRILKIVSVGAGTFQVFIANFCHESLVRVQRETVCFFWTGRRKQPNVLIDARAGEGREVRIWLYTIDNVLIAFSEVDQATRAMPNKHITAV